MAHRSFKLNSGVSLLELLVALAIMAMIGAALARSFGVGIRVWENSQVVQEQQEPLVLRTKLRDWLERATPPNSVTDYDMNFYGNSDGFSFLTQGNIPYENSSALRVSITNTNNVMNMEITYLDYGGEKIRTDTRQLSSVQGTFSYYIEDTNDARWVEEWVTENQLPALIKIETSDDNWPEFTVAPLLR